MQTFAFENSLLLLDIFRWVIWRLYISEFSIDTFAVPHQKEVCSCPQTQIKPQRVYLCVSRIFQGRQIIWPIMGHWGRAVQFRGLSRSSSTKYYCGVIYIVGTNFPFCEGTIKPRMWHMLFLLLWLTTSRLPFGAIHQAAHLPPPKNLIVKIYQNMLVVNSKLANFQTENVWKANVWMSNVWKADVQVPKSQITEHKISACQMSQQKMSQRKLSGQQM